MSARKWAAIAIATLVGVGVTGCAAVLGPGGDESYEEKIPAALIASDLGIIDAGAGTNLDGFTRYLFVTVTLDDDAPTVNELSGILTIILEENTIRADEIELDLENAEGEDIDFTELAPSLGLSDARVSSYGWLILSFDEAREYIKDTGTGG